MDRLFFFPFLFLFLTMAPQVLEKKIALLFTYRKIVIIFKSVVLNLNTLRQVSRNQKGDQRLCNLKKRKKAALVGFIHVSSLTTGSPLQKQQEKVKSQQLTAFSLTSRVQEPSAFHSESSKQVPRSWITSTRLQTEISKLAWRVEVIQPVVRACTTF